MVGVILVFLRPYVKTQRVISLVTMIGMAGISLFILNRIQTEGILRLDFGGWEPPFGILFVADSFAMLLVLTASIVTAICLSMLFLPLEKVMRKCSFIHLYYF